MPKKFINADDIKLDAKVVYGLKKFCETEKLDPRHLFLFYDDNNIVAGFSEDEAKHIQIHDNHWIPVINC